MQYAVRVEVWQNDGDRYPDTVKVEAADTQAAADEAVARLLSYKNNIDHIEVKEIA